MSSQTHHAMYDMSDAHPEELTVFDMLLPPQAAPLLALFLLVAPLVLLTGESLFIPLFEWIRSHFFSNTEANNMDMLPLYFFIKLGTFMLLSFLGGFQLLMRIKSVYYATWAKAFPRPDALHVDYQANTDRGLIALLQWKLYQSAMIILPPIVMGLLTFLVGLIELYLFNTFSELSFIGLSIQLTIELFVILMLCLFTGLACLNSIWTASTTLFGDIIAVTEPDLPNAIVLQRCSRLAFASPYVYSLIPAYLILAGVVITEVVWLLNEVDVHQFIHFEVNVPLILFLEVVTISFYLGFSFFKFYTYHHSLVQYYHKMPPQLKECFTPPPPLGSEADEALDSGY